MSFCYPEGNFGRNQLLDGSISLSPLYPSPAIDLHVRTATSLHQSFLWLRPPQESFTIFRVATHSLYRKAFRKLQARAPVPPRGVSAFTFIARSGLPPKHSRACSTPWSVFQDGSLKAITPASQGLRPDSSFPCAVLPREAITQPELPHSSRVCPARKTMLARPAGKCTKQKQG